MIFLIFFVVFSAARPTLYEKLTNFPQNFVFIAEIDPSIPQELRSASNDNPLGRRLPGIFSEECVLARKAAVSLQKVQKEVQKFAKFAKIPLTLRVFECYRPKTADEALFYSILQGAKVAKKRDFSPVFAETELISRGFLQKTSEYNTGFAVAVTLSTSFLENVDMGSNFWCFHEKSFRNYSFLTNLQRSNRKLLQVLMRNQGFVHISQENWWQFSLKRAENAIFQDFFVRERGRKPLKSGFCPFIKKKPDFFEEIYWVFKVF